LRTTRLSHLICSEFLKTWVKDKPIEAVNSFMELKISKARTPGMSADVSMENHPSKKSNLTRILVNLSGQTAGMW
jgi:hypothetical protein